ncbi:Translational repressor Pumilio/PUF3, RNA-binding proteins (Puf superfamily) [Pseudoloma neurophilia]|uniref:Translational repressor Pumilio/PUF3, RNA-binding proteins (Puf superfamily) n=1 Tax=Pseudoloma neurophilia TaxID=146866 RepID=A0A0R0LZV9_9MICR|nr:Translational repressor Pumilio/PUF3, RNA-binding proteins (Puf superfamily) [Pseudoloma neurophilia]
MRANNHNIEYNHHSLIENVPYKEESNSDTFEHTSEQSYKDKSLRYDSSSNNEQSSSNNEQSSSNNDNSQLFGTESDSHSFLSRVECKEYDKNINIRNINIKRVVFPLNGLFSQKDESLFKNDIIMEQFSKTYGIEKEKIQNMRRTFCNTKSTKETCLDDKCTKETCFDDKCTKGKCLDDKCTKETCLDDKCTKGKCTKTAEKNKKPQEKKLQPHYLTVTERIDSDQPRTLSVPYQSNNEIKNNEIKNIPPIGYAFLRRIYYSEQSESKRPHDQIELNVFKNDIRTFTHKRNMLTINQVARDQDGSRFIQKRLDYCNLNQNCGSSSGSSIVGGIMDSSIGGIMDSSSSGITTSISNSIKENGITTSISNGINNKIYEWLMSVLDVPLLCTDLFGNYVIQRLIDDTYCKGVIYEEIKDRLLEMSTNTFGCRVVQKLLFNDQSNNESNTDDKNIIKQSTIYKKMNKCNDNISIRLANDLLPFLNDLVYDSNGNHVVQRVCLITDVSKYFYKQSLQLARHKYGCRVLQKMFEVIPHSYSASGVKTLEGRTLKEMGLEEIGLEEMGLEEIGLEEIGLEEMGLEEGRSLKEIGLEEGRTLKEDKILSSEERTLEKLSLEDISVNHIITLLKENAMDLAVNQYGNYVLQHIININILHCKDVLNMIYDNLYEYSMHKYASNVIETIIHTLLNDNNNDNDNNTLKDNGNNNDNGNNTLKDNDNGLTKIVKVLHPHCFALSINKYGNYVIQRILESNDQLIRNTLKGKINQLKHYNYAKGVVSKLLS